MHAFALFIVISLIFGVFFVGRHLFSNRQPTVVRVDGVLQSSNPSAEVPSELELAPLLNGRARRGEKGNFSILIQPDGELLLGQPAI